MHYREKLLVNPGRRLRLKDIDPGDKGQHESEQTALPEIEQYRNKLTLMQFAAPRRKEAVLSHRLAGHGCGGQGRDGQSRTERA